MQRREKEERREKREKGEALLPSSLTIQAHLRPDPKKQITTTTRNF